MTAQISLRVRSERAIMMDSESSVILDTKSRTQDNFGSQHLTNIKRLLTFSLVLLVTRII